MSDTKRKVEQESIIVDDFGRSSAGQLTGIMAEGETVTIGSRRVRIVSIDRGIPMANGFAPNPMAGQSRRHRLHITPADVHGR